jgi:hypothetical protein
MTIPDAIVAACADHTMMCDKTAAAALWAALPDEYQDEATCHRGPHRCDPAGPAFAWPAGTASTKTTDGTIPTEWPIEALLAPGLPVSVHGYEGIAFRVIEQVTEWKPGLVLVPCECADHGIDDCGHPAWDATDVTLIEVESDDPDDGEFVPVEGRWFVHMVGDDRRFDVDVTDIEYLPPTEFCGECGQIGCGHGVMA